METQINHLWCYTTGLIKQGTGYSVGDILTPIGGGTYLIPIKVEITSVDVNGGVTGAILKTGVVYNYTVLPVTAETFWSGNGTDLYAKWVSNMIGGTGQDAKFGFLFLYIEQQPV